MKRFIEFGYFKESGTVDTEALHPQLTGRLFRASGKVAKIESKIDWKSRNQGNSPDEADAVSLMIHAVRKASGVVLGMDVESTTDAFDDEDDWGPPGPRISSDNRFQDLDT